MRRAFVLLALTACGGDDAASPDATPAPFAAPVVVVEAGPGVSIQQVRASAGKIFWTESSNDGAKIVTTTGEIASVGGDGPPTSLGVAGDHAVLGFEDLAECAVYAFPLDGGAMRTLEARDENATCVVSTDGIVAAWSYTTLSQALVQRARVDLDEAPTLLWSDVDGTAHAPVVHGADTYWIADGVIWRHDGVTATHANEGPATILAIDGDQLVWQESSVRLLTAPLDALAPTELAASLPPVVDLAFDDAYVYAQTLVRERQPDDTFSWDTQILAIARDTGDVVTIASHRIDDGQLSSVAAADGGVYYGDDDAVMFAARND